MAKKSEYLKVHCPLKDLYGLLTIDKVQGVDNITNFQPLDKETAKNIDNSSNTFPPVSPYLLPCDVTGKRIPASVDKSSKCRTTSSELSFQCLYCSKLTIPSSNNGPFDIFFLLDESGSMSIKDRLEAVNAVKNILNELDGMGNLYSFIPWGTEAGYLFKRSTDNKLINAQLKLYHKGKTGYRGRTCPDSAFNLILPDVQKSSLPVIIVFVTDGRFENDKLALKARNNLLTANPDAKIIAIGITEAKQENIDMISTVKELSAVIGSSSGLTKSFMDVAAYLKSKNKNV